MNYQIVFILFIALGGCHIAEGLKGIHVIQRNNGFLRLPPDAVVPIDIPDLWFDQVLDHFNPSNPVIWKQKYYVVEDHYKPGGPVFIFVGGEGPASTGWMTYGTWIENAKKLNALCFYLEHRYYGDSHPTPDVSVENLRYLNSQQAIADVANFIDTKNREYNLTTTDAKWVAFGGSYAGNLVAWLRLKYPHLVHIAIASSGPVLAKLDYFEYYEVVADSLNSYNPGCTQPIKEANEEIEKLLQNAEGIQKLNSLFHVCPGELTLDNKNNQISLLETAAGVFAGTVQYNNDANPQNINFLCNYMVNETLGNPIDRLATLLEVMYGTSGEQGYCISVDYEGQVNGLKSEKWEDQNAYRAWMFQTCTEFGYYQTSSQKVNKIWGNSRIVDFYIQQCEDIYTPRYNRSYLDNAIERTNTEYGGLNIDTPRILHVHGTVDPWHALGVTNSSDPRSPSILVKGSSHCADMYPVSSADSDDLKNAKLKVASYLEQWLQEE